MYQWQEVDANVTTGEIDNGRTLGVVVGDFDRKNGNDVYFANDTSANHYFVNQSTDPSAPQLVQSSGTAGVAVNGNGRPQGSMGIAVADVDHNGLDDILVTNAYGEYNTLYLQRRPNLFVDGTRTWNLHQSSIEMVSFGCVFADVDNDSWEDFMIVNGNLDDYTAVGENFTLPAQFFRNDSSRMVELDQNELGSYFKESTLGRGLATIDYDVDHRPDFVATHCERNAALIKNSTTTSNHFIELQLVGVTCDRDAIGARVTVHSGSNHWSNSLYAGEGYYSSSEMLIRFGLGSESKIDKLVVEWPDGSTQTLDAVTIDSRYLLVQAQEPYLLQ